MLQCPGSHGDVLTVICVMVHKGLDCAVPFWRSVTDEHHLLVWHYYHPVFTSCSAWQSRPLPFFPPGCTFSVLSVPSSTCALHIRCWRGGDICQAIAAESFTFVQLRTVIFRQMRMISFLSSLAVFPTCYLLHDSHLLGLTPRPSAPVSCCHQVSWTRGRLAFAQEAVRCPPGCLWVIFLQAVLQCEGFA